MAQALGRRYDLDLVVAQGEGTPPTDFGRICASITCMPPLGKVPYELNRAIGALNPRESYFTSGQVSAALRRRVAELVAEHRYTAVQVGDLNQQAALPDRNCPPIWYDAHNCEYQLVRRQADYERIPLKWVVKADSLRVRHVESTLVERARYVTTCTHQDLIDLAAFCPSMAGKSTMIPSGVDVERFESVRQSVPQAGSVLLSGSMNWRPTQQGLMWFVEQVLPLLPQEIQGVKIAVRVAGRMNRPLVASLSNHPRLTVIPNPADMREELARADLIAVPVLASSGVRVRIFEAWAAGRPVVTTPSGALGLNYINNQELLARSSPQEFADAILKIITDRDLWRHVRTAALAKVADFDWPKIADRIIALHEQVFPA
ncbi:MAG: glycosyltransferase [Candidatus Eremiobacteraeota bacterium]|nr:glycosyltransferase [Candidatus Eremiobacteraeota bacterium]MBC5826210.1 glycosyltransferase [Candidatus Eremiobacteraeota bacterium]